MSDKTLADHFIADARRQLAAHLGLVKHCLAQLDDDQLWRRPRPEMNSIGNLLLHLAGNLRQRFLSVVGGVPDDRDRPREFSERSPIPKADLLPRLEEAVGAADALLTGLTVDPLLEVRRHVVLRGEVEETVLAVVLGTLLHLAGHAQEIVYATRLLLGDAYQFRRPQSAPARALRLAADDVVFESGMMPLIPPAPPQPAPRTPPAVELPRDDGTRTAPRESPLRDPLLELEQEFQDQQEEGKL